VTDATAIDAVELLCTMDGVLLAPGEPLRMGDALAALPFRFRHNFVLKHGREITGTRGHAFERMADLVPAGLASQSQSATPTRPRVIMWDERTGLSIAFNAGVPGTTGEAITGGDRLDIHTFDRDTATFGMFALDLPIVRGSDARWSLHPFIPDLPDDNCTTCHGPLRRPIWPMYPDWPGFYGSDNDELTQALAIQRAEAKDLFGFRQLVLEGGLQGDPRRRYATLFAPEMQAGLDAVYARVRPTAVRSPAAANVVQGGGDLQAWLGLHTHDTFPFRPDHATGIHAPSRAFFHRPNLRLGVLYNRLLALHVAARLEENPLYRDHRPLVLATLMACGRLSPHALAAERREVFVADARRTGVELVTSSEASLSRAHLMRALGWRVRDLDIRFTYTNPRYDAFESPSAPDDHVATHPMDLGLLRYGSRDFNLDSLEGTYFNSYWDGSATFDELLVARLLEMLGDDVQSLYEAHSLTAKYGHVASRMALDAPFFAAMDGLTKWFPLPFPKMLLDVHHRQSFLRRSSGETPFRAQHQRVCRQLDALALEANVAEPTVSAKLVRPRI